MAAQILNDALSQKYNSFSYDDLLKEFKNSDFNNRDIEAGPFYSNLLGRNVVAFQQANDEIFKPRVIGGPSFDGEGNTYSTAFALGHEQGLNRDDYHTYLGRGEDGNLFATEAHNQNVGMAGLLDLAKFVGMAASMGTALPAMAGLEAAAGAVGAGEAATGAGWTSGYDLAGGSSLPTGAATTGLFNSGLSTGNELVDKLVQKGITKAGTNLLTPDGTNKVPSGTGTTGGNGMADSLDINSLLNLFGTYGVMSNGANRVNEVSNSSADRINGLATSLADKGKFTPYNVVSGIGRSTMGADGSMYNELDPYLSDQRAQSWAQITDLLKPYANQNVSDISGQAYDKSKDMLNRQVNPLYAQNEQRGLFGAGNLLDKAAGFDPEGNARSEYDLMQQLMAPTRESDNLNMENRLRSQGRLGLSYGAGGAAPELSALKQAQRMQDLQATKDSRQIAFDRQNGLINQAGALNTIGINSGNAGTAQQKANYDMANGLFGMGMSGDKFINDMNASRIGQANNLQDIGLKGEKMLMDQSGQALQAGSYRSNAEANNANLLAKLGLSAEGTRTSGAFLEAALKNDRDKTILKAFTGGEGGSGGFLNSATGKKLTSGATQMISGLIDKLTSSGMSPDDAVKYITDNWSDIVPEGVDAVAAGADALDFLNWAE